MQTIEKTYHVLEVAPGVFWSGFFVFRSVRIGFGKRIAVDPRTSPHIQSATPIELSEWNGAPDAEPIRELLLEKFPNAKLLRVKALYQVVVTKEQADGSYE